MFSGLNKCFLSFLVINIPINENKNKTGKTTADKTRLTIDKNITDKITFIAHWINSFNSLNIVSDKLLISFTKIEIILPDFWLSKYETGIYKRFFMAVFLIFSQTEKVIFTKNTPETYLKIPYNINDITKHEAMPINNFKLKGVLWSNTSFVKHIVKIYPIKNEPIA